MGSRLHMAAWGPSWSLCLDRVWIQSLGKHGFPQPLISQVWDGEKLSPPTSGLAPFLDFVGYLSPLKKKNLLQTSFLEEKEFTSLIQRVQ